MESASLHAESADRLLNLSLDTACASVRRSSYINANCTNLRAMAAWPFARSKLARRATLEYCKVRADADRDRESASVTKKLESCMLILDY